MSKKITLMILSLIISVSVILTPSLSAFAFGVYSFSDSDLQEFKYNGTTYKSATNSVGFHIVLKNGQETISRFNLNNGANLISSSIIYGPVTQSYYFVAKLDNTPRANTRQLVNNSYYRLYVWNLLKSRATNGDEYFNLDSTDSDNHVRMIGVSNNGLTPEFVFPSLYSGPVYFWFNSHFYWITRVTFYNDSHQWISNVNADSYMAYESTRYSELKADELAALGNQYSDLANAENIGGVGEGASDYLTEPAVDASSESEQFSEEFSGIDEMISNIDDFSELASSNLAEVSGVMSNTRSALDKVLEWLPRPIIILCIFGLVALIIVKIMGR